MTHRISRSKAQTIEGIKDLDIIQYYHDLLTKPQIAVVNAEGKIEYRYKYGQHNITT